MTDKVGASLRDAEAMLVDAMDMKSHLAALKRVDPVLAREIGETWQKTTRTLERIVTRNLAAKMILNGQFDHAAVQIVQGASQEAMLKLLKGEAKMSDTLKRAMEEFG